MILLWNLIVKTIATKVKWKKREKHPTSKRQLLVLKSAKKRLLCWWKRAETH